MNQLETKTVSYVFIGSMIMITHFIRKLLYISYNMLLNSQIGNDVCDKLMFVLDYISLMLSKTDTKEDFNDVIKVFSDINTIAIRNGYEDELVENITKDDIKTYFIDCLKKDKYGKNLQKEKE